MRSRGQLNESRRKSKELNACCFNVFAYGEPVYYCPYVVLPSTMLGQELRIQLTNGLPSPVVGTGYPGLKQTAYLG